MIDLFVVYARTAQCVLPIEGFVLCMISIPYFMRG